MKENIVCHFGTQMAIITDLGKQFDNANFREFYVGRKIDLRFASVAHPQTNGLVEATNKTIKKLLKKKLQQKKGLWVEELPNVLWAYRTTRRTATGETPYSLVFGTEAVSPIEHRLILFASNFIFHLLCLHRMDPCMVLHHHIYLGMFFTNFI